MQSPDPVFGQLAKIPSMKVTLSMDDGGAAGLVVSQAVVEGHRWVSVEEFCTRP